MARVVDRRPLPWRGATTSFWGVDPGSTGATIRFAITKKSSELTRAGATRAEVERLEEAAAVLTNMPLRRAYDGWLRSGGDPAASREWYASGVEVGQTMAAPVPEPRGELPPPGAYRSGRWGGRLRRAGRRPRGEEGEAVGEPKPVRLHVRQAEELSRFLLLIKWLLVIPVYVVLLLYGIAVGVTSLVAAVVILVTGRYPSGLFGFAEGYMELQARTYLYFPMLMTDEYPFYDLVDVELEIQEPASLSRFLVLVKGVALYFGLLVFTIWIVQLLLIVAAIPVWFAILFTGRYPRVAVRPMVALGEWAARLSVWQGFMRDEVPWIEASKKVTVALAALALVPAIYFAVDRDGSGLPWNNDDDAVSVAVDTSRPQDLELAKSLVLRESDLPGWEVADFDIPAAGFIDASPSEPTAAATGPVLQRLDRLAARSEVVSSATIVYETKAEASDSFSEFTGPLAEFGLLASLSDSIDGVDEDQLMIERPELSRVTRLFDAFKLVGAWDDVPLSLDVVTMQCGRIVTQMVLFGVGLGSSDESLEETLEILGRRLRQAPSVVSCNP